MEGIHLKRKDGRKAYFSFFADGKYIKNLGEKIGKQMIINGKKISFEKRLKIVGKTGIVGFEGMKYGGGKRFEFLIKPSKKHRKIVLRIPLTKNEDIGIILTGNIRLIPQQ